MVLKLFTPSTTSENIWLSKYHHYDQHLKCIINVCPLLRVCVHGVCVCVCVCVCTLDGLNAEHTFRVCHVTFRSTIHSKKKKKRVSFNPYKDIYYCLPLKL